MTIYLHVGVGKTGTTTLQVFLENHRKELARHGLTVAAAPKSRNHRALAMYALDYNVIDNARKAKRLTTSEAIADFRADLRERVAAESATLSADATIVFTSEQLTRVSRPSEFARLKDLLALYGTHEIKIIAYLRRQDQYYASSYSQYIKGGQDLDMRPSGKLVAESVYDYLAFLNGWAESFGDENLIVRVFERSQLKDGDVIADFFEALNIEVPAGLDRPARQNESLDINTVQYLRMLNRHMPRFIDGAVNKRRPRLIAELEAISDGARPRLAVEEAQRFMDLFEVGNAEVARRFLGRADGRLFLDPLIAEDAARPQLDLDRAMEITARLLDRLLRT